MKFRYAISAVVMIFGFSGLALAQGFVNLDFESTVITVTHNPGGDTYTATIPGWGIYGFPYGNPTSVGFNDVALDAPAVTLQGTTSAFFPAIQGSYSVLLQGGTVSGGLAYNTNGASVFQAGKIPLTSRSLLYLGGAAVRVTFNGQALPSVALNNEANYTLWGVDVSAYAGQSGELRFIAPWQSSGMLDDIQFSSSPVPEPSTFALGAVGALLFCVFRWWNFDRWPRNAGGR